MRSKRRKVGLILSGVAALGLAGAIASSKKSEGKFENKNTSNAWIPTENLPSLPSIAPSIEKELTGIEKLNALIQKYRRTHFTGKNVEIEVRVMPNGLKPSLRLNAVYGKKHPPIVDERFFPHLLSKLDDWRTKDTSSSEKTAIVNAIYPETVFHTDGTVHTTLSELGELFENIIHITPTGSGVKITRGMPLPKEHLQAIKEAHSEYSWNYNKSLSIDLETEFGTRLKDRSLSSGIRIHEHTFGDNANYLILVRNPDAEHDTKWSQKANLGMYELARDLHANHDKLFPKAVLREE